MNHDFVDGTGQKWDVKGLWSKYEYDLEEFLDKTARKDLKKGENILFNTQHMTEEGIAELENACKMTQDSKVATGLFRQGWQQTDHPAFCSRWKQFAP